MVRTNEQTGAKPSRAGTAVVAALSGAVAGGVAGVAISGVSSEAVTAVGTVFLSLVTAAYVALVYGQLNAMKQQNAEHARRWDEQRSLDLEERRRQRSEEAAWIALEALYDSGIRPGAPDETNANARDVFLALEQRAPFVMDAAMADRMKAAGVVAWMMSWDERSLQRDRLRPGMVQLSAREIVERCSGSLQRFLNGEPLPPWDGLPEYARAQAWVYDRCREPASS